MDNYRTVDDRPYGGGPGMVMLAEPIERTLDAVKTAGGGRVVYLTPQGRKLDHRRVMELRQERALTLLCGRYEGVDERLLERRVDEEVSVGDFVLSGGEIAAMALVDAVVRQLPGALGDEASALEESFADGLLDCPQYTRPEIYSDRQGAGGAALGTPREHPPLAAEAGAGKDLAAQARPARGAGAERGRTEAAGRIQARAKVTTWI